ncbi:MAG: DUF2130 domain-containing protein [Ginsengibacter sp.]
MPTLITCPNCKFEFAPEDAIAKNIEKEYANRFDTEKQKMQQQYLAQQSQLEEQRKIFEENKKKENELFSQRLQKEKQRIELEVQQQLTKTIAADFENRLKILQQANANNEEKLKASRHKELEFLKKEQELKNKEADLEIQVQKKLQQERQSISEQIRKQEIEKNELKTNEHLMRMKEMEKQIEDQKKLVEEMRRKADQVSMQLQGEVQELLLESILREHFPFDLIEEVGKGVEGADCIQVVRNNVGRECGKIIYESKRTKGWMNNWIDKLKADKRSKGADTAILVTQVFPKGMERFAQREGIWICSYSEVASVAAVLRNALMCVSDAKDSQENKGEKMQMLYDFLTGIEFRQHIEAIVEGFMSMKTSIIKERIQMEKIWKEREKQLDKVLLNTSGMYGSVRGIAGSSVQNIPLLDDAGEADDMAH